MKNGGQNQVYSFDGFELDAAHRRLVRDGKTLPLNAKAFDLLVYLAENAGRVVTKDEIMNAVWADQFVEEANLKVQMSALRKALGERKDDHRLLVTVPGIGYKFVGDIHRHDRELVIESHRVSRLVVEEEVERATSRRGGVSAARRFGLFATTLVAVGGLAILLATVLGAYRYVNVIKADLPYAKIKLTRITNNGRVAGAAVSPDGKYIAYVLNENEGP